MAAQAPYTAQDLPEETSLGNNSGMSGESASPDQPLQNSCTEDRALSGSAAMPESEVKDAAAAEIRVEVEVKGEVKGEVTATAEETHDEGRHLASRSEEGREPQGEAQEEGQKEAEQSKASLPAKSRSSQGGLAGGAKRVSAGSLRKKGEAAKPAGAAATAPSPIRWFPRQKKESFLERKIRLLQEKDGVPAASLDEALGAGPQKLGRLEREKMEAAQAAKEASETRRLALIEASWCRILDAAGIPSFAAVEAAKAAEKKAAEALAVANEHGVVLDQGQRSPTCRGGGRHDSEWGNKGAPPGMNLRDAILTSVQNAREVEREVVLAVKEALAMVVRVREEDGIVDTFPVEQVGQASQDTASEKAESGLSEWDGDWSNSDEEVTSGGRGSPRKLEGRRPARAGLRKGSPAAGARGSSDAAKGTTGGQETQVETSPGAPHAVCEAPHLVQRAEEERKGTSAPATSDLSHTGDAHAEAGIEGSSREGQSVRGDSLEVESAKSNSSPGGQPVGLSDRAGQTGGEDSSSLEQEEPSPRQLAAANEGKEESLLVKVMAGRVKDLKDPQRAALAAIVSTRGLVNGLLEELRDVRETGVRRISSQGLGDILVKHVSRLEAEKAAAKVAAAQVCIEKGGPLRSKRRDEAKPKAEAFGSTMRKHTSRLDRELMEAKAQAAKEKGAATSSQKVGSGALHGVKEVGLAESLVKHKSRLEKEKDAAKAAAASEALTVSRGEVDTILVQPSAVGRGLADCLDKKPVSRLEKERAAAAEGTYGSRAQKGKATGSAQAAQGGGLGDGAVRHMSKLEKEIEAARSKDTSPGIQKQVWHQKKPGTAGGIGLGDTLVKHKSKLQLEIEKAKAQATDSLKPGRAAATSASMPAGRSAELGGLGEAIIKHKSRLEMEKEAAMAGVARGGISSCAGSGGAAQSDPWAGQDLGSSMKKHVSKLELAKVHIPVCSTFYSYLVGAQDQMRSIYNTSIRSG
eukprot:jgi/Mesen1/3783/ME000205S03045